MDVVRLITCETAVEAYLIKGRLENAGIPSFVTNEHITTLMPYLNPIAGSGVQVMVNKEDYPRAKEIISTDDSEKDEEYSQ